MAGRSTGGQVLSKGKDAATGQGKWLIRWYEGQEAGKNKYASKLVRGTKKDAQAELAKITHERSTGSYVEPSKDTLDAYLDRWLDVAARAKVRARTLADYTGYLRLYIRPALGAKPLAKVTPLDVQETYTGLQERGLSPRTIRLAHAVLRSALAQAVKWRLLAQNPAIGVELPATRREEMRALTREEWHAFIEAACEDRYGALFLLAGTAGLRPSEYLGLQWPDIDLKTGTVSVRRSLSRDRELQETKRPRSRRTVKLQAQAVKALIEHRDRQAFERRAAGDSWQEQGLVFTTEQGRPVLERNLVRRHFSPILIAAGLGHLRLYDLRHTAATHALAAGVSPKVVSEMLGHASVAFTLDTYAHLLPHMQEDAARQVEAWLSGVITPGAKA